MDNVMDGVGEKRDALERFERINTLLEQMVRKKNCCAYVYACMHIYLSIYLFIYRSIHPSIFVSIYLYILV